MFSAHSPYGRYKSGNGTSIIDVGLLRPAAAPGGRRVDGSRLGVAIFQVNLNEMEL